MTTKLKDPNAVKDYLADFSDEMFKTSDTIATIVFVTATPAGLTIGAGSPPAPAIVAGTTTKGVTVASSAVRMWLSGGTVGATYAVLTRITTTGGRTHDLTGTIRMSES